MKRRWFGRSFACSTSVLLFTMVALSPATATAGQAGSSITSLTLNPTTIAGGSGGLSIGTVTISGPAAAGGQVITLSSSNTDLTASTPRILIPEGATSATFIVGTNPLYRSYSGLAFNATITATAGASSASAVLQVTAQAIPGPFTGDTRQTDARATAGNICGGAFGSGSASERGILYRCEFPGAGQFSVCRFLQECAFGCQTVSADRLNRRDVCATAPPFPIVVNPAIVEGGRRSNGTVFLSAPAAPLTNANVSSQPIGIVSPLGGFEVPQGATSAPFDVDTLEVVVPAFVQTRVSLSLNPQERFAQDYLAVVPAAGTPRPSGPLAAFLLDLIPLSVVQGNPSIGTVVLNGVAPSGGAVVSLSSSHPAASVPATVTVPRGQTAGIFGVSTGGVASPTPVVITATFGGASVSETLIVSPFVSPTTAPALASLTLNPTAVDGGVRSRGRVTMTASAADPSDGAVIVELASDRPDIVVVQKQVTVGFGGTFADFAAKTFPVTALTQVMITATYAGRDEVCHPHRGAVNGSATTATTTTPARPNADRDRGEPAGRRRRQRVSGHGDAQCGCHRRRCGRLALRQLDGGVGARQRDGRCRLHERHVHDRHDACLRVYHRHDLGGLQRGHANGFVDRESSSGSDGHADRDGHRPQRRAGDLLSGGHQRGRGQHGIGVVCGGNLDHAAGNEQSRRDLVWRLFERRRQEEDVHVHVERQRERDRERAMREAL